MNHSLTVEQKHQMHAELSRRYHLMLANLDREVEQLRNSAMPIDTYTERYNAIYELRRQLREQYEKDEKQYD